MENEKMNYLACPVSLRFPRKRSCSSTCPGPFRVRSLKQPFWSTRPHLSRTYELCLPCLRQSAICSAKCAGWMLPQVRACREGATGTRSRFWGIGQFGDVSHQCSILPIYSSPVLRNKSPAYYMIMKDYQESICSSFCSSFKYNSPRYTACVMARPPRIKALHDSR